MNTIATRPGNQRAPIPANRSRRSGAVLVEVKPSAAATAAQAQEQSRKEKQVQDVVRTLMGTRGDITPKDFHKLLFAADSNLDRLLARLQRLIDEERQFDNFLLLCSEVRALVLIL